MRLVLWTWVWASVVALAGGAVVLAEPRPYLMIRDLAQDAIQRMHPRPYDPASPVAIVDVAKYMIEEEDLTALLIFICCSASKSSSDSVSVSVV